MITKSYTTQIDTLLNKLSSIMMHKLRGRQLNLSREIEIISVFLDLLFSTLNPFSNPFSPKKMSLISSASSVGYDDALKV